MYADAVFFSRLLRTDEPVYLPPRYPADMGPRLSALETILTGRAERVFCCLDAARAPVWTAEEFRRASVKITRGEEIGLEALMELFQEMGYRRMNLAAEGGEFAARGGIVDVYPAIEEQPYRIEFFGDAVESIRVFDVETQRSFREVETFVLMPVKEPEGGADLLQTLEGYRLVSDGDPGDEGLQPELCVDGLALVQEGTVFEVGPVDCFGVTARERRLSGESLEGLGPRLADLARQYDVLIVSESQGEAERVRDFLHGADVMAPIIEPEEVAGYDGRIAITRGRLSGGFHLTNPEFLLLTTEEIFGTRTRYRPRKRSRASNLLQSLDDLSEGDLVVHVDHGVGRFVGMKRVRVEDHEGDFLHLEYAEGATLYLPVDRIEKIRKYHASGDTEPDLHRLGGKGWEKTKSRVRKKVQEMADKLVRLYAEREASEGFAFSPDTDFHREFAEAFAYEETPDQETSIRDVTLDMESTRPMDRLLCGDVGYGKTEVAMRAAFKAVADSKQVAVLVPTTILAEQHYENFVSRFSAFPVRIDVLSRFKPRNEQRETLRRLAAGEIDIIIGTHALLSKNVTFADLGLLIVDEEHKFGVSHKEKIKGIRQNVDILTLSATPIPRTLQMALSGIRGISTIETPPEERLAVKTLVARHRSDVIREAVDRELSRSGQVFFVHNRIETIYKTGTMLQNLVPESRIGVAHGQMNEKDLEQAMHEFYRGDLNLLLCTSIIGSGLDVPRANTIIVDRAERFGLADLYQLKGRVGRSDVRAFAYFLIPGEDVLTSDARKRIQAIQELSFLGAGFRLAMKDLEIRGAGNLLGAEQSGHIEDVGYDLYVEMLEQAVAQLKGAETKPVAEPVIELQVKAVIPETYLDDSTLRFTLYRRIAAARETTELEALDAEIRDRFGSPPGEVVRLLEAMSLKILCRRAGVSRITQAGKNFRLLFSEPGRWVPDDILRESGRIARSTRFLPQGGVDIVIEPASPEHFFPALSRFLTSLASSG